MRLGLASYTFTWAIGVPGSEPEVPMTALDLIDRAAELGVGVVQITDNLPLHALSDAELRDVKSRASERGVDVEVGTRGIAPNHLGRYLEIARYFGAPFVRIVVDNEEFQPSVEEIVAALKTILPLFEQSGITLALENHDRFRARELVDILNRLDSSQAGICLDTANSYGAQEGMREVAEILAPWTVNLHVKDYTIARLWHNMGFTIEGRPVGQGKLDIPWLLDLVRTQGRGSPNAIIELWTPREVSIASTIQTEASWAEESVRYMRTLLAD